MYQPNEIDKQTKEKRVSKITRLILVDNVVMNWINCLDVKSLKKKGEVKVQVSSKYEDDDD